MLKSSSLKLIFFLFIAMTAVHPAKAQLAGIQRSINTINKNTFSYSIQSTIGTRTSANVSGNILADTEAILNLQRGGKITNKIGDANGNASAVFTTNPTGAGVDLKGITGENVFLIDNGTSFKSSLTSDPSLGSGSSIGEASSLAIQSTTVTVEKGNSSFVSSFQEAF